MFPYLLHKAKYFHLKMIFEHPKGIQNRFRNTGDKWISSLRHPHIKTYSQFFHNQEHQEYEIQINLTEKEQNSMERIKHAFKPGMSVLTQTLKFKKTVRPDDEDMEMDVSGMNIKKFIEQGRKNFTQIHKLVLAAIGFIIGHIILYFVFIYGKELPQNERVQVLNAELLETYHFQNEESDIKRIIQRIQIVNGQFEKRLAESKNE